MKGITVCCDGENSLRKELAIVELSQNKEKDVLKLLRLLWKESFNKKKLKKNPPKLPLRLFSTIRTRRKERLSGGQGRG